MALLLAVWIIGIVADGQYVALREDSAPYMYLSIPQFPSSDMNLLVHTSVDPATLTGPVERALQSRAPDLPAPEVSILDEVLGNGMQDERLAVVLVGCLRSLRRFWQSTS